MNRADDIFAALVEAHRGLDEEESLRLDARLILLLANEVGDGDRVLALIEEAHASRGVPNDAPVSGSSED